jgi:hypothetical protein
MTKKVEKKPFEEKPFGFDRTQMFKEWTHPQIVRQSALSFTTEFCQVHGLKLSTGELLALNRRIVQYIETGDESWTELADGHIFNKKMLGEHYGKDTKN